MPARRLMQPTRIGVIAALVGLLLAVVVPSGAAAVEVSWGTPRATATYGQSVRFEQPATLPAGIRRVELLLESPGAIGPLVIEVEADLSGRTPLSHALEIADGHILPNTTLTGRWRVVGDDGTDATGPPVTVRYEDTRFAWRTREGEIVRVHWYDGSDAFGERALAIGEAAVKETAELLGVVEDEPVDFFVYAEQDAFYDALGPSTRENVGGQANAEIRTLFALIGPNEIDDAWVGVVVPHELVHLVFDTAVDNPYHFPPRWLNEGLATYLTEGFTERDRQSVEAAARDGTLIPLRGLAAQFPTTRERFFLAYAESTAAVDFLVREHGRDALVRLVRSYSTGLTDDEAFEQAIGMPVDAFDAAWREDLGAQEPVAYGPQPAPAGPLPPGWTTVDGSPAPTARPGADATSRPAPPQAGNPGDGGVGGLVVPMAAGLGLLVLGGVVVYAASRRRRAEQRAARQWAAWRANREPDRDPGPPDPDRRS
jgi:hypothetical protein